MFRALKPLFKLVIWLAVLLGAFGGVMHYFFVGRLVVGHNGMAPTILAGDQVLYWKDATLDMGDIAFCRHPSEANQKVIGRVTAKPGMTVRVVRGQLEVEGTRPSRDIRDTVRFYDPTVDQTYDMIFGIEKFGNTDHYFFERKDREFRLDKERVEEGLYLLGDNRTHLGPEGFAKDSRQFGPVDREQCIGDIFMRLQPADVDAAFPHGWLDILD